MEDIVELSKKEEQKIRELIRKKKPCFVFGDKDVIDQFKKWINNIESMKKITIPDDEIEILLHDESIPADKFLIIPLELPNDPIEIIRE